MHGFMVYQEMISLMKNLAWTDFEVEVSRCYFGYG